MTMEPELWVDKQVVCRNIEKMSQKVLQHNMVLRPHFKTHQSAQIADWFRHQGIWRCAVSSLKMAHYFARHGWKDIMIAFPFIPALADQYSQLARQVSLTLFLSDQSSLPFFQKLTEPVEVMVEIDTGHHRTGLGVWETKAIQQAVEQLRKNKLTHFAGFAVHAGETYLCKEKEEVEKALEANLEHIHKLKSAYPGAAISYGDTPSLALGQSFHNIDEARPGNFVFYDLMQLHLGTCAPEDIALHIRCPVVASYPQRNQIVVHGGAVHLSKEQLLVNGGRWAFGLVADSTYPFGLSVFSGQDSLTKREKPMLVKALSQEHGIIEATAQQAERIRPGQSLPIIPVHACLTASQFASYRETKSKHLIPKMSM